MQQLCQRPLELAMKVSRNTRCVGGAVNLEILVDVVRRMANVDILFAELNIKDTEAKSALHIAKLDDEKQNDSETKYMARILVNNAYSETQMRYAIVHEIYHIFNRIENESFSETETQCFVSTYVCDDVRPLLRYSKSDLSKFLQEELQANIFANLVLMPRYCFAQTLRFLGSVPETAEHFKTSIDAVDARVYLARRFGSEFG